MFTQQGPPVEMMDVTQPPPSMKMQTMSNVIDLSQMPTTSYAPMDVTPAQDKGAASVIQVAVKAKRQRRKGFDTVQ